MLRRVPAISLPACAACHARLRRSVLVDVARGGSEAAVAVLLMGACMLVWPWVPAFVVACVSTLGAALAWLAWRLVLARARWQRRLDRDPPAVWVSAGRAGACLEVCSSRLADVLTAQAGVQPYRGRSKAVVGVWQAVGLLAAATILPWATAEAWFATVRVVHVSPTPLEIFVDGRSFGVVVGVEGEDSSAVREIRVPRGTRTFEARALNGTTVNRTTAVVGEGAAQIYIAFRGQQCFWVEQRAYGQASRQSLRVLPLGGRGAFVTLSDPVDSWFEANPEPSSDGHRFSGGIRGAVRHGPCASSPVPGR